MKAMLEFNLPEDQSDHEIAVNGWKWKAICEQLDSYLRQHTKHGTTFDSPRAAVDMIRKQLWDLVQEYGVSFDE